MYVFFRQFAASQQRWMSPFAGGNKLLRKCLIAGMHEHCGQHSFRVSRCWEIRGVMLVMFIYGCNALSSKLLELLYVSTCMHLHICGKLIEECGGGFLMASVLDSHKVCSLWCSSTIPAWPTSVHCCLDLWTCYLTRPLLDAFSKSLHGNTALGRYSNTSGMLDLKLGNGAPWLIWCPTVAPQSLYSHGHCPDFLSKTQGCLSHITFHSATTVRCIMARVAI